MHRHNSDSIALRNPPLPLSLSCLSFSTSFPNFTTLESRLRWGFFFSGNKTVFEFSLKKKTFAVLNRYDFCLFLHSLQKEGIFRRKIFVARIKVSFTAIMELFRSFEKVISVTSFEIHIESIIRAIKKFLPTRNTIKQTPTPFTLPFHRRLNKPPTPLQMSKTNQKERKFRTGSRRMEERNR